jgi:hypothetical protein
MIRQTQLRLGFFMFEKRIKKAQTNVGLGGYKK